MGWAVHVWLGQDEVWIVGVACLSGQKEIVVESRLAADALSDRHREYGDCVWPISG